MSEKKCKNCDHYESINLAWGRCRVRHHKLGEDMTRAEWWGCDFFNVPYEDIIEIESKESGK